MHIEQAEPELSPTQREIVVWLEANGFSFYRGLWGIAWSHRSGYDFTDLEFMPHGQCANPGFEVIVGYHASGTNPRMNIGTCQTLEDVQRTYEAIRLINGYPKPEDERQGGSSYDAG